MTQMQSQSQTISWKDELENVRQSLLPYDQTLHQAHLRQENINLSLVIPEMEKKHTDEITNLELDYQDQLNKQEVDFQNQLNEQKLEYHEQLNNQRIDFENQLNKMEIDYQNLVNNQIEEIKEIELQHSREIHRQGEFYQIELNKQKLKTSFSTILYSLMFGMFGLILFKTFDFEIVDSYLNPFFDLILNRFKISIQNLNLNYIKRYLHLIVNNYSSYFSSIHNLN